MSVMIKFWLFVACGAMGVFLMWCQKASPADQQIYAQQLESLIFVGSPEQLWDGFMFFDHTWVQLESVLISYSDLSLRLHEIAQALAVMDSKSPLYDATQNYYESLQVLYQEELNTYVMDVASLLRQDADTIPSPAILSLQKNIMSKSTQSWKVWQEAYKSYLDNLSE